VPTKAQGLADQAGRVTALEQFRWASAQALEALERQHAGVLSGLHAHELERAAMQSEVVTSRDELLRAGKREAGYQRQLQQLLWTVWSGLATTVGLALAACSRAFGWFEHSCLLMASKPTLAIDRSWPTAGA
jgi:hypothetical protein